MSCERTESLELVAFWVDRSAPEWADLRDHYPRCVDCSEAVAALSEFVTELETRATASAHPDPERLLDFAIAQSSLPADARARIESHVAHCSSCRDELHVVRHRPRGIDLVHHDVIERRTHVHRDLDLNLVAEVREQWAFYRDRRPDAYGPLVAP